MLIKGSLVSSNGEEETGKETTGRFGLKVFVLI